MVVVVAMVALVALVLIMDLVVLITVIVVLVVKKDQSMHIYIVITAHINVRMRFAVIVKENIIMLKVVILMM